VSNIWDEREESMELDEYQQRMIDRLLPIIAGKKVLDIGCGYCNIELELADVAGSFTAVDDSKIRVQKSQERCAKYDNINVQLADENLLPYFDVVFSFRTFQHMEKKQFKAYCKTAYRVLKNNGIFIFQVVERYLDYQPIRGKITHLAHTEKEISKALKMFDEVKYEREIIPRKKRNFPWLWIEAKKC